MRKHVSVRKIKSKSSPAKPPRPALPNIPSRPFPNYANYQPPPRTLSPVSSDSDQEGMASRTKKRLSPLREDGEKEAELGQHNGSLRSILAARGDVKHRIKAFEMTSSSDSSSLSSVQSEDSLPVKTTVKPPVAVPRAKIRNLSTVESPPPPLPSQPPTKSRSKSTGTPPNAVLLASAQQDSRPTPPPKNFNLSPPRVRKVPIINTELVDESPPQSPQHEPSRPSRPDVKRPQQPPRPTLSVYKRAKDRSRSASPNLVNKCKGKDKFGTTTEESEDSDTSSVHSSRSTNVAQSKPRHKVKKTRSQSSADQLLIRPSPPSPSSRRKTSSESADNMLPPLEASPKNTVEGAIGKEEDSLNEEMAGTIIKYILSSPDPKLKAALKDLIKSDEGVMKSLK